MLSGADLIKTSGQIQERAHRLKAVPDSDVKKVESPGQTKASLDQDTQNALMRFARFIKDGEKKKPKEPPKKVAAKGLPQPYLDQIQSLDVAQRSGGMINIFA